MSASPDEIVFTRGTTEGINLVAQAWGGQFLRKGDVITSFNGVAVNEPNVFRNQVASTQPDSVVTLNVLRDGREIQVRATLGEVSPPRVEQER